MGIYIPIEMPKLGECIVVYGDGDVWHHGKRIAKVGTAVEVPPHGRLGDLDALLADHGLGTYCPECKRDERSCQFEMIHTTMDFCGWIEDAPTIIPASGGNENE